MAQTITVMVRVKRRCKANQGRFRSRFPGIATAPLSLSSSRSARGRLEGFDGLLALYARGLSTRDIQEQLEEIYAVELSPR